MSKRANDFFDSEQDFQAMLDKAEQAASSDWEIKFVDKMTTDVGDYGFNIFMSEEQYEKLKEISEK